MPEEQKPFHGILFFLVLALSVAAGYFKQFIAWAWGWRFKVLLIIHNKPFKHYQKYPKKYLHVYLDIDEISE